MIGLDRIGCGGIFGYNTQKRGSEEEVEGQCWIQQEIGEV